MNSGKSVRAERAVSWWEDRLSRFVEHHQGLFKLLGNLETWAFSDEVAKHRIDRPIYISGLARAGSTVLLELLAAVLQTVQLVIFAVQLAAELVCPP